MALQASQYIFYWASTIDLTLLRWAAGLYSIAGETVLRHMNDGKSVVWRLHFRRKRLVEGWNAHGMVKVGCGLWNKLFWGKKKGAEHSVGWAVVQENLNEVGK